MKKINLFFLRNGYYECIVTINDTVSKSYHRKVTLDLEPARAWEKGTLVGSMGAVGVDNLAAYTDDYFFYINAQKWLYDKDYQLYMALPKAIADGKEYYTRDLSESINGSSCVTFLFPKLG